MMIPRIGEKVRRVSEDVSTHTVAHDAMRNAAASQIRLRARAEARLWQGASPV
jgi:hypothetical protein